MRKKIRWIYNLTMKIVRGQDLSWVPASHEDAKNPGVLKKVLFTEKDVIAGGKIQMINWARLNFGKSFIAHYHEDMDEIFIIVSGKVRIKVDKEEEVLEAGDAVLVPMKTIHKMKNIGDEDVNYLVIGVSLDKGGKTITK